MDSGWKLGRTHVSINRLYHDVLCPEDCKENKPSPFPLGDFMYCEDCLYGFLVCTPCKGALHKYGATHFDNGFIGDSIEK